MPHNLHVFMISISYNIPLYFKYLTHLNNYVHYLVDNIVKNLEIFQIALNLVGSASIASQLHYSDYDFNCKIKVRKQTLIFNEFKKILSYSNDKLYFIEFKIEYNNDTKLKINDPSMIRLRMFKNIKFVKIDYIVFLDYVFKEVSIMYIFKNKKETDTDRIQTLRNDYDDLMAKGESFKALKRLFSIYKIKKDYINLKTLTSLFNSNIGKIYEMNSNLKTIQLLKTIDQQDNDDDDLTQKRIHSNLKFLRIDPDDDLNKIIKENDKILNNITVLKK